MSRVWFAVEGWTDIPVAQKLIRSAGREPQQSFVAGGKSRLDPRIPGILDSSSGLDWLILRDLDHDAPCASALVQRLFAGRRCCRVFLRVAVRASESWLLADAHEFAREFNVPTGCLPESPDRLENPKQTLVEVCGHSRRSEIRTAMTPRAGSGRRVGPEYAARIVTFARQKWEPDRAALRSPSLARTLAALKRTPEEGGWGR